MREQMRWSALRRLEPPLLDIALALLFVAITQSDVWMPWGDGDESGVVEGPLWVSSLLLLVAIVPFAWRRRAPLVVVVALLVGLVGDVTLVAHSAPFLGGFIPLLVAGYTVAAYESRGRALLGGGLLVLGLLAVMLSIRELRTWSEMPFELLVFVSIWLVGRLVGRLRSRERALADHADTLERRRDNETREAVDRERARIARELHDVVAHSVSLMGIQAAAAEQVLALDPERAREPLQAIQVTARDAIDELRRLLGVLRDSAEPALGPQPGLGALDALVEQMRAAGLGVDLRVEGDLSELSPGIELSAYRVVQEALTNALKHAGAARTTVLVRHRGGTLELEIADDGRHRNGHGDGTGHGLIGMRERVALYGGTISAGRGGDGGFSVRASLPTHAGHA